MKISKITSTLLAFFMLAIVTVASANPEIKTGKADPELSTFYSLVEKAGLSAELAKLEGYTIFAPSNKAFAAIGDSALAALSVEEVKAILMNHIVATKINSAEIAEAASVECLGGAKLSIVKADNLVKINEQATVITADLASDNGIIHKIDTVILQQNEVKAEEVKTTDSEQKEAADQQ